MSTSPVRSRSLRKPSTTSTSTATTSNRNAEADPRLASPSRLPVKPHLRSASTTTASTLGSRALNPNKAQPSGIGRTVSTARQNDLVKKETARYPPSTSTTRPGVGARPTSSDGQKPQPSRRVPTHTRAKSTTTATSINPSTVLRPPSQGSTTSGTRAPQRRVASAEKTARPLSTSAAPPPPSSTTTASTAAAPKAQPRLRPTFSSLQQHYSPAKSLAPKPLTSTFLAPPSPSKLPANLAASAETSKLQTELLQLYLLHRDAAVVDAEWQASARERLGERFELLNQTSREITEQERAGLEEGNVLAFRAWGGDGGLEGKIQGLDTILSGMWTLTDAGGRYARMVRRFERWLDQVSELHEARRVEGGMFRLRDGQALFVDEVETKWKDDLAGIIRRLDGWGRQLQDIRQPPDVQGHNESSLSRMLRGLRALIDGMLEEVHLMEEMEQDALANEEAWIEATNKKDDDNDTQRAGAIWRVM